MWQIGYVDMNNQGGSPLGRDPWWVAITATNFVGGVWFGLSAPFAILLGGCNGDGMVWSCEGLEALLFFRASHRRTMIKGR